MSDSLTRHYDLLTPWERFPLLVAAQLRGDPVDGGRLIQSDRKTLWRIGECRAIAEGLDNLAAFYVIRQLEIAADYWQTVLDLERYRQARSCRQTRRRLRSLHGTLRMFAYQAVLGADAWDAVCSDLHIDATALYDDMAGYQSVAEFLKSARTLAFRRHEAMRYVRQANRRFEAAGEPTTPAPCVAPTVAEVAAGMWQFLRRSAARWGVTCP